MGIIFGEDEDFGQRGFELAVGGDFVGGSGGVHVALAGFGDVSEDFGFVAGETFDGFDEIGNQIGAALEDDVDLGPRSVDGFALDGHLISPAR